MAGCSAENLPVQRARGPGIPVDRKQAGRTNPNNSARMNGNGLLLSTYGPRLWRGSVFQGQGAGEMRSLLGTHPSSSNRADHTQRFLRVINSPSPEKKKIFCELSIPVVFYICQRDIFANYQFPRPDCRSPSGALQRGRMRKIPMPGSAGCHCVKGKTHRPYDGSIKPQPFLTFLKDRCIRTP